MTMKIVSGLGSIDDYEILAAAGADEFFIGYVPFYWNERYGNVMPLNRREVLYYNVQIGASSDLKILKKMVDYYGVPVKITLNSLYYTKEQYSFIERMMMECMEAGFNVFILSDPALIRYIREKKIPCKIHLSGETAEVNRYMMEVFDEYEISRYIFHRKNSIEDMERMIASRQGRKGKEVEYEAFLLNEYCHFTGAFCNSLHCDEMVHICKLPYKLARRNAVGGCLEKLTFEGEDGLDNEEFEEERGYVTGNTGCGLCALKELENAGVTHLKIVGRGNYTAFMEQDIKMVRRALAIVEQEKEVSDYKKRVKEELFSGTCSGVCYYR